GRLFALASAVATLAGAAVPAAALACDDDLNRGTVYTPPAYGPRPALPAVTYGGYDQSNYLPDYGYTADDAERGRFHRRWGRGSWMVRRFEMERAIRLARLR